MDIHQHIKSVILFKTLFLVVLVAVSSPAHARIIFTEDFEDASFTSTAVCSGNCPTVSTERSRAGRYSMKSVLNPALSEVTYRTEMAPDFDFERGRDYWIGVSTYLDEGYTTELGAGMIFQMHNQSWLEGPSAVEAQPLVLRYMTGNTVAIQNELVGTLARVTVPQKQWVDWVIHMRPDVAPRGLYEVWMNGEQVVDFEGETYSPTWTTTLYWKMGIYSSQFRDATTLPNTNRIVYHDELRFGDANSSYNEVAPPGSPPPPTGTTPSTCTNQQTSTATIPTGYGASYNPLTSAREYLVQASCTGTTQATVTAGNGNPLTYVYNRGYYWTGSTWTAYTLSCASGALISNTWCPGRATASIPLPQNPTNVIAYTCQYTNSTWKCGCRDATCSTAYWQLQRVGR